MQMIASRLSTTEQLFVQVITCLDFLPTGLVCSLYKGPIRSYCSNLMYRGLIVVLFVVQRYLTSGNCKILLMFYMVDRYAEW